MLNEKENNRAIIMLPITINKALSMLLLATMRERYFLFERCCIIAYSGTM